MTERLPGRGVTGQPREEALIRPDQAELGREEYEEEPRGSLVILLLFLAAMVGIWLYVYFLLIERV